MGTATQVQHPYQDRWVLEAVSRFEAVCTAGTAGTAIVVVAAVAVVAVVVALTAPSTHSATAVLALTLITSAPTAVTHRIGIKQCPRMVWYGIRAACIPCAGVGWHVA